MSKPNYDRIFKDHPHSVDLIKCLKVEDISNVIDDVHIGRRKAGASYIGAWFKEDSLTIRAHPDYGVEIKIFGQRRFPIQVINGQLRLHGDISKVRDLAMSLQRIFR
ncbi:MAG: hypothetical protein WC422_01970 [Candidatus Paceibacterota bacterium]|jgi:hypothetical protein